METSDCIIDGLYLGGILAALNENDLQEKGISHILSVDESPLPQMLAQKYHCKHVYAIDYFDTDLLSCFSDTFVFIEQAKNVGGSVLVHWLVISMLSSFLFFVFFVTNYSIKNKKVKNENNISISIKYSKNLYFVFST